MTGNLPNDSHDPQNFDPVTGASMGGIGAKEQEFFAAQEALQLEQVRRELEIAPEAKEAGLENLREEIELPPALKKIGIQNVSIPNQISQPQATAVPLADSTIIKSTGGSIWSSLTWLALWCLKQLKKAHVKLKKVHGKIVRVVSK